MTNTEQIVLLNELEDISGLAINEAFTCRINRGRDFASHHEAYAVIKEELDELWDEIKKPEKSYDKMAMRKEASQIAAMCLRFINELT